VKQCTEIINSLASPLFALQRVNIRSRLLCAAACKLGVGLESARDVWKRRILEFSDTLSHAGGVLDISRVAELDPERSGSDVR
jgi:hypothetical protein